uniref:Uncharacterized protein n=1 Tax=Cacopsylla melanoneura TaxID=428564 RepID=A0A8D9E793_9HEMI
MLMIFNLINTGSMTFFQFVVYQQPYGQFWLTFLLLNALGLSGIFFGFFTVSLTNSLTECAGVCIVASLAMYTFTGESTLLLVHTTYQQPTALYLQVGSWSCK